MLNLALAHILLLVASSLGATSGTSSHDGLRPSSDLRQADRVSVATQVHAGGVTAGDVTAGNVTAENGVAGASVAALPSRDWTAKAEDNICGLRDLSQVSNPAVIDFQACLDATPEMKKVKSEKIDLKSPEGIRLLTEATNRVTEACESVAKANGYCSIWKSIKHKDGRVITDVSNAVTALF